MRAEQRAIAQLLQPKSQFLMPEFQRSYVWKKEDVHRLWDDIHAVSQDPGSRHFLGAIVLSPIPNAAGFTKRFVVDGQQRLTTLGVLFCALRDHAAGRNPKFASTIDTVYLLNQGEEGEARYKLVPLATDDRAEWLAIVRRAATAGGDNLVGAAYRTFRSLLAGRDYRDQSAIVRLEQTIAYQCEVVEVEVEPDRGDNEYRIFNSLNEGGVKLQQSDLVRSFMLMKLPTRGRQVYAKYWGPIQDLLKSGEVVNELVQANLILRGRPRVSSDSVYRVFRQLMQGASEDQIEAWAAELFQQAQLYRYLVGDARPANVVLRGAVDRLVRWDSKAGHPLAVAILSAHERGKLDQNGAAAAIRVVESYLVRRALVGIDSRDNSDNIARVARDLSGRVPTPALLAERLAGTSDGFPADDQVREAIMETNAYVPNAKNHTVRFVLRYVEDALEPREQVDLDDRQYTIEHILPRGLTDDWRGALTPDAGDSETADEVHAELVHKLGNLTLTAYNRELGQEPWAIKREQLARSGLAMNRAVATHATWGRTEITDRGIGLADLIVQVWPGPAAKPASGPPAAAQIDPVPELVATSAPATADEAPEPDTAPSAPETPRRKVSPRDLLWSKLPQILAVIPAGRWTSFLDIGLVLGVGPGEVGQRLQPDMVNAHRVLRRHRASPTSREQMEKLRDEGVVFDANGKAIAELRCNDEFLRTALDDGDEQQAAT